VAISLVVNLKLYAMPPNIAKPQNVIPPRLARRIDVLEETFV